MKGDDQMCQALLEIMEPEINKIKEALIKNFNLSSQEADAYINGIPNNVE